jgi:predicted O-methyltransferase YrrM
LIYQVKAYLSYRKKALKKVTSNSEFVSDLLVHVFDKKDTFYAFKAIEFVRESLKMNTTKVSIEDLGAGSKKNKTNERTVRQIITSSAKAPKYGQLLFRLANYLEINNAIELGTSLGISTAYIKKARKSAQVYTLEGAPNIVKLAEENFNLLKLKKLEVIEGNFDQTLQPLLDQLEKVDFVFFDGNHKEAATLNYFNQCLTKVHNDTVFVFDDIYWSEGMTNAWEIIKRNNQITLTIDVFELGIVFFKKDLSKQNLIINY